MLDVRCGPLQCCRFYIFFFFSSRRRHTRFKCDWSSDVCSSDLGEAYSAFAWAVYVAEVEVDLTTYSVSVKDFVAVQEIGKVLHPVLATGQIAGGVAQAIGFALYEKVNQRNGRMQNGQMTNYIMPTSVDLPPIRVFFEEIGSAHGAYGAKGIGELPMDGPAPAIVNAVEDATSIPFNSIPLLPEDVFEAMTTRLQPRNPAVPLPGPR